MGIDVYLTWDGRTKEEEEKQYTGFSLTQGSVGYLREAYHGNPYATRVLMPEAFNDADYDGVAIPATTLKERLGDALTCTLVRDLVLYQNGNPASFGSVESDTTEGMIQKMAPTLIGRLKAAGHQSKDWFDDYPEQVVTTARLGRPLTL